MKQWLLVSTKTLLILLLVGCGGGNTNSDSGTNEPEQGGSDNLPAPAPERDYRLQLPATYDESVPAPLVVLLHGYSGNGDNVTSYFRMDAASDRHGFVLAVPQGSRDVGGNRYWNATDACCAFDSNPSDDVAYLKSVIEHVSAEHSIDPHRIYVAGHSNGGFMAHRLACELSPIIAGAVSLAGASWNDPNQCAAQAQVSVLQIHGDIDSTIFLTGGVIQNDEYPSALDTVAGWADRNGCTGALVDAPLNIDLLSQTDGTDTRVQTFEDCPAGGAVSLWTMYNTGHIPELNEDWFDLAWEWMAENPKP